MKNLLEKQAMSEQPKEVSLEALIEDLPPELVDVAKSIHSNLDIESFSMSLIDMAEKNGRDLTGLEVLCRVPDNGHGVVVFSYGDDWFIAVLGKDGNSEGGWQRPKKDTSLDDVVAMIRAALLMKSGRN